MNSSWRGSAGLGEARQGLINRKVGLKTGTSRPPSRASGHYSNGPGTVPTTTTPSCSLRCTLERRPEKYNHRKGVDAFGQSL